MSDRARNTHYLAKAGCVLPEHLRPDSILDSDLLRITPSGHVHLELAHRDINYLAACAEDSWVTSSTLAEGVRQRITQQPYWRGLSWHNTLANAADFCGYLKGKQDSFVFSSPYLPNGAAKFDRLDLQKVLDEIANHKNRSANYQSAPPDLSSLHDHTPQVAD